MSRVTAAAIAALVFAALPAGAQGPAPDQSAAKPGTIRGRITAADSGRPLARTRVMLNAVGAPPAPAGMTVTTTSQGTFEMKDVTPGAYFVSAQRSGFVTLEYGQRRPGERGTAIEVGTGRLVERIDIALPRGAALGGRVVDELGEPFPNVRVMALHTRYRQGARVPMLANTVLTDDQGRYRIAGLQPGSYFVAAASMEVWQNEQRQSMGYATTYFPGVAADLADTITLAVAQERLDLDFTLTMRRTARVRGRLQRESGAVGAGDGVTLGLTLPGQGNVFVGAITSQARTAADGSFEIQNVPPGDYVVSAASAGERDTFPLTIHGDIDNLNIVLRNGSTINGTLVSEEGTPPPFNPSGVRVDLQADVNADVLPTVRSVAVNSDWTYRLTGVGGPFKFRLRGVPDGWMLHAVRLEDRDLTDVPWDVPTGGRTINGLQIVVTDRIGTISGEVIGANGKPAGDATVVLFAEDRERWTFASRYVHSTRPDRSGRFTFSRLPEGTYLAIARDFIESGQEENPAFLESLRRYAERIVLGAGASESVTLKLSGF